MTAPFICALLTSTRLYNLSRLERKAIERYICESLTSRLIYPSSSPVGAGFFFVKKKGKLHLTGVAFFSRRLSTTERNYYVGNYNCWYWCWHFKSGVTGWLEGAAEPFIIWTNNKNLAYLRGAKRLNSRQAQWALFLARFDFLLTYQPGSKNVKRDVLSRQFSADLTHRDPEPILRRARVGGATLGDKYPVILCSHARRSCSGDTPPG